MWSKGVHHRDISVGNLMYRRNANGEFFCGVLNDWDLSKLDGKDKESLFRTGTRAFLAQDFLKGRKVTHLERNDWESVLYVLVWITTRYDGGSEVKTDELSRWIDSADGNSLGAKALYLNDVTMRPAVKPMFEDLYWHWIAPLSRVFKQEMDALNAAFDTKYGPSQFDISTLGGNTTYERLWAILKEDIP